MSWLRTPAGLLALFVAAVGVAAPAPAGAGDPRQVWKTIESEHFVVHYYEPLGDVARRAAVVAERAHRVLAPVFRHEPEEKTQIVLTDETDGSNGFASVLPRNAIRLFASAPSSTSALSDHDDWLYGLTAHEYTHILHLDSITGLPKLYNKIFGKTWAPNQIQPRWVIEGIATYQESKRSSSGRLRHSLFDMNLRMATLKDDLRGLDELSHGPRAWPQGNAAYLYGSHFLAYVFDRYGEDALAELSWNYGSDPIPYGLNKSIERATGRNFVDLYEEWEQYRQAKYGMQREAVERAGRREGRRLTFTGQVNFQPKYTPDGDWIVWSYGDGLEEGQLATMPVGGNQAQQETFAVIQRSGGFEFLDSGSMVVEQTDILRAEYSFQELFLWDHADGSMTQLTENTRARDPAVSPDGRQVAFAVNGAGRRELAIMDLRPGAPRRVLWGGEHRYDQAFDPAFSPDGRSLAFSAWRKGGYRDILIVDLATGAITELARDRAADVQPVYDPHGRYLYYASDRTGIFNLYAHELATGTTYQVTNVLGCAIAPDVSPDGTRLVYQGFDSDGYELYEIAVDPTTWTEAPLYVDDRPAPTEVRDDEIQVSSPRPYRPLETLGPRRYTVQLVADSFGSAVNVQTTGADVARRHVYQLGATISLEEGDVSAGASYAYNRLWPSLRLAAARGVSRRTGLRIDGRNTDYIEERLSGTLSLGLPVLREPDGSGTLSLDYDVDVLRNLADEFEGYDPNELVPGFPESDVVLAGAALRWSYSNLRSGAFAIGPIIGNALSLSMRFDHPAVGSDFESLNLGYSWAGYRPLPLSPTSVLAVRVAGGLRTTSRTRASSFVLGGVPEQDIVRSVIDNLRAGVTGYLRGYPARAVIGRQYHLANLELRHHLVDLETGAATLPFYLRRLHVAALTDYGNAFDGPLDLGDFKWSVGAALRLDMVFGYFVPGALDIGYARGLSEGGEHELWMLLTGTL